MNREEIAKRMRGKDTTNATIRKVDWKNLKWKRKGNESLIQSHIDAAAEETGLYNLMEKYGSIEKAIIDDTELLARAKAARDIKEGFEQTKRIEENFRRLPREIMELAENSARNWHKNSEKIIKKYKEQYQKKEEVNNAHEENK